MTQAEPETMATHKPNTVSVSRAVQEFVIAAERLLRPIPGDRQMTKEECVLISEYLAMMCRGSHAWMDEFVATIGSRAARAKSNRRAESQGDSSR
jgi:hypothetical protein